MADYEDIDFEQDLKINVYDIGDEWLRLPALIQKYGKLAANAANKKERAKAKVDWQKAQLDFDIRKNPEDYDNLPTDPKSGKPKITDATVASAIILEEPYREAVEAKLDAVYEHASMQVLSHTMGYKATALEYVTKLVIAGWFGEGKGNVPAEMQESFSGVSKDYAEKRKIEMVEKKGRQLLKRRIKNDE